MYEKTSVEQHQAVSKVIMSTEPSSFIDQMKIVNSSSKNSLHIDGSTSSSFDIESGGMNTIFGNMSECSIGNITININADTKK